MIVAGRFELERLAGSGGMAEIHLARDRTRGGAKVALKMLLSKRRADEVGRFEREAELLAGLHHPSIVEYVAHGVHDGNAWLAMEWLEGEDLHARLRRGALSIAEAIGVGIQIADALAAAHAMGIVHRDIKPANLFLVDSDLTRLKVLDFGIARVRDVRSRHTATGSILGTPGYLAPEQARGVREIDTRADVFALGCVLFECIAGTPAFSGEHVMSILAKILLEEAPRLGERVPDVPPMLDALVARMLAKDPSERPEGGAASGAALRSVPLTARSTVAPPPVVEPTALTIEEQRLLCVVLLEESEPRSVEASTAKTVTIDEGRDLADRVRGLGGRVEPLADGSWVITPARGGSAADQAVSAAQCALAIHALFPDRRMAIATGRVDAGAHILLGEVIDRAARELRGGVGVRIDEVTAGLIDARFDVRPDDGSLRLHREREGTEGPRTTLGRESPFVGRDAEIGTLLGLLEEVEDDSVAHAALVTGGPGVGKSRLHRELVRAARARPDKPPPLVWTARADPMRAGSPFGLIADLLQRAASIRAGESIETRRDKLLTLVQSVVPGGEGLRIAEFLGEAIGAPFAEEESVQLRAARREARLMADQIRRAWLDFLRAQLDRGTLLVVLEELHWGDLPSVRLVEAAVDDLHERPLFVLALARAEVREQFPRLFQDRLVQLQLTELSRKGSERLVRQMLGTHANAERVERIVAHAGGNAFFLEELVRAAIAGHSQSLPETALAMAEASFAKLSAEARRVLRAASIFGRSFWPSGVRALVAASEREVEHALEELTDAEIAVERDHARFVGERELGFRHLLLREAAYAMLTPRDRALGHRLAGDWLEAAGETDASALAEHFARGELPVRAIRWFRIAAHRALEGNDIDSAIAHARRALSFGAEGEERGVLEYVLCEAYHWRGAYAEGEPYGRAALEHLPKGSPAWCTALGETALSCGSLGHREHLMQYVEQVLAVAPEDAIDPPLVLARTRVGIELLFAGELALAHQLVDRVGAAARAIADRDPAVVARVLQFRCLVARMQGDPNAPLELDALSAEAYEAAGDLRRGAFRRCDRGYSLSVIGRFAEAVPILEHAIETGERLAIDPLTAGALNNLGLALAYSGRLAEGRAAESRAVEMLDAQQNHRVGANARIYLAKILVLSGELEEAEAQAEASVRIADKVTTMLTYARAMLASVRLKRGKIALALEEARAAKLLLDSLGGIDDGEAFVRLTWAQALRAGGDEAEARRAIADARDRVLGAASKLSDPSSRDSFLRNVPENAEIVALANELGA